MIVATRGTYLGGIRLRSIAGMWFRHVLVLRHTWLTAMTWYFVEPFVVLVAVGVGIGRLVENVDGVPYAVFVTPGIIAGSALFHAIFECSWGAFFRIQKGVYETILTAPVSTRELTLGEILWAMTRSVITATCIGAVAAIFGWIESPLGAGVLLAAALVGMQFGALGLIFAALARSTPAPSASGSCVGRNAVRCAGTDFCRIGPEHPHPVADIYRRSVAALFLQRVLLPDFRVA